MSIGKEAKTSTETPKQQPATRSLGWVIPVLGELRCTAGPVCMWGFRRPPEPQMVPLVQGPRCCSGWEESVRAQTGDVTGEDGGMGGGHGELGSGR